MKTSKRLKQWWCWYQDDITNKVDANAFRNIIKLMYLYDIRTFILTIAIFNFHKAGFTTGKKSNFCCCCWSLVHQHITQTIFDGNNCVHHLLITLSGFDTIFYYIYFKSISSNILSISFQFSYCQKIKKRHFQLKAWMAKDDIFPSF